MRLLGPVDVIAGDAILPVSGLRRKAVMSALALRPGGVVDADRLIDAVWDGKPPATALNTLQSHLSHLRRILKMPGAIVARPPGYVLNLGAVATDVQMAEALIERGKKATDPAERAFALTTALNLWRGHPLEDVAGLSWFGEQAARLDRIRRGAERELVEARLRLGQHTELVPELESLVAPYPYNEDLHRLLMIALYRSGRQTDSLAVYRRLRDRLLDELGINPSAPLRELETAILRQDPGLDLDPAAVTSARSASAGAPLPALVERSTEMRLIDQALDGAVAAAKALRSCIGMVAYGTPYGTDLVALLDATLVAGAGR